MVRSGRCPPDVRQRPGWGSLGFVLADLEPRLADRGLPRGPLSGWAAEPNLDGWRVLVTVDPDLPGGVVVRTRRGHPITDRLPGIDALGGLGRRVVLDGELVAGTGTASDFYGLLSRIARRRRDAPAGPVSIWAFDVLCLDDEPLLAAPYLERRAPARRAGAGRAGTAPPPLPRRRRPRPAGGLRRARRRRRRPQAAAVHRPARRAHPTLAEDPDRRMVDDPPAAAGPAGAAGVSPASGGPSSCGRRSAAPIPWNSRRPSNGRPGSSNGAGGSIRATWPPPRSGGGSGATTIGTSPI
jgi:hypothetical protein